MQLPYELRAAIEEELTSWSPKRLGSSVAALSKRYRNIRSDGGERLAQSPDDVAAYTAFRLPATFAAVSAALRQMHEMMPEWSPRTLLDVGAGPGTAAWAAANVFPQLLQVTLLEREERMIALGKRLAQHAPNDAMRHATWLKEDVARSWQTTSPPSSPPSSQPSSQPLSQIASYDLVIASYVLGELREAPRSALVKTLWARTSRATGALLLIEPGTPVGFGHIKAARTALIEAGAQIVAPCPHSGGCPLAKNDWCHFAQRVERSRLHRLVKEGELAYEDEKFSFVGVARVEAAPIEGRVLRHPLVRKGQVGLQVCAPDGTVTAQNVTRKDRAAFRRARNLKWGSAIHPLDD